MTGGTCSTDRARRPTTCSWSLSGAVAVVGRRPGGADPVVRVHGARRFLGELDLLSEQPVERTAVVAAPGEVLQVPVARLHEVFAADAGLRDVILRAFLVRRAYRLQLRADAVPAVPDQDDLDELDDLLRGVPPDTGT